MVSRSDKAEAADRQKELFHVEEISGKSLKSDPQHVELTRI